MKGVLVTGANGFLGNEPCRPFRDGGVSARRWAPRAGGDGVKYMSVGEIGSGTNWSEAL